jgi:hypothetical protein
MIFSLGPWIIVYLNEKLWEQNLFIARRANVKMTGGYPFGVVQGILIKDPDDGQPPLLASPAGYYFPIDWLLLITIIYWSFIF